MKFTDIGKIAKANKTAIIMTDRDGCQWLSAGVAAYLLEGMPQMDADSFLNLSGVTESQKEKWHKEDIVDEKGLFENDRYGEMELTADDAGISIAYNGNHLTPLYLSGGVIWVNVDHMVPVVNRKSEYLRFYSRRPSGQKMIAVKDGLVLVALIGEFKMNKDLLEKVETLHRQCTAEGVEENEV